MSEKTRGNEAEQYPVGSAKSFLPWVLTIGGKKAPAVTALMVGALVVFAVALTVLRVGRDIALWKILLMAVAGIAIGLVALLVAKGVARRRGGVLAEVAAWTVAAFFFAVIALVISVVFFGAPRAGTLFLARIIDAPQIVSLSAKSVRTINSSMHLTGIDPIFRRPPGGRDRVERVANLSKYPGFSIEGAVLSANPGEHIYLATNTLELMDSTITTNGASLTIEVLHLSSSNSRIHAFDNTSTRREGEPGDGGSVTIIVHDQNTGAILAVDLSGQTGAPGVPGQVGNVGPAGGAGANAADHLADCGRGPGDGSAGGKGGAGGVGSPGVSGGDGGILVLAGTIRRSAVEFRSAGGTGGQGGRGGQGGPGGPGGPGGSSSGSAWCHGSGHPGPQGQGGDAGPDGANGRSGRGGDILMKQIDEVI